MAKLERSQKDGLRGIGFEPEAIQVIEDAVARHTPISADADATTLAQGVAAAIVGKFSPGVEVVTKGETKYGIRHVRWNATRPTYEDPKTRFTRVTKATPMLCVAGMNSDQKPAWYVLSEISDSAVFEGEMWTRDRLLPASTTGEDGWRDARVVSPATQAQILQFGTDLREVSTLFEAAEANLLEQTSQASSAFKDFFTNDSASGVEI